MLRSNDEATSCQKYPLKRHVERDSSKFVKCNSWKERQGSSWWWSLSHHSILLLHQPSSRQEHWGSGEVKSANCASSRSSRVPSPSTSKCKLGPGKLASLPAVPQVPAEDRYRVPRLHHSRNWPARFPHIGRSKQTASQGTHRVWRCSEAKSWSAGTSQRQAHPARRGDHASNHFKMGGAQLFQRCVWRRESSQSISGDQVKERSEATLVLASLAAKRSRLPCAKVDGKAGIRSE